MQKYVNCEYLPIYVSSTHPVIIPNLSENKHNIGYRSAVEIHALKKSDNMYNLGNGILFPKFFWPTVRKKISSDWEKHLKFEAEGRAICKLFEITRTIYSKIRERSVQF